MNDRQKTKHQLIDELKELRQRVSKLEATEEALRESEEQYRAVYDNASIGIELLDRDGRVIQMNQALLNMLGYSDAELRQLSFLDITHPHDREISKGNLEALMAGQIDSYTLEKRYLRKDGGVIWGNLSASAIRDANGEHQGTVEVIADITERKRAEEASRSSELRYRRLFEAAKDGILILDAETGQIVDVNPFLTQLLGYSREEMLEKKLWEIGLFEDVGKSRAVFAELQRKEYVRYDDLSLQTIGGEVLEVEFVSNVYLVNETKVIQCNLRDITGRRRTERALIESEERFRTVADFTYDWEYWIGTDDQFLYVSPSCERITGYSAREFVDDYTLMERIIHPDDLADVMNHFHVTRKVDHDTSCSLDFRIVHRDGQVRWINHVCRPVKVRSLTCLKSCIRQLK